MKYTIQMGLSVMLCIPRFIKSGSGIQKSIRRDLQRHKQHGHFISLLLFFKKISLKVSAKTLCILSHIQFDLTMLL
jgi:hypothetical protein